MRTVTIIDLTKRIRSLQSVNESSTESYESNAHVISENGSVNDIKRCIEAGVRSNQNVSINTYLELFDALVEKGNVSSINKYGRFIANEAVSKVRDAKQTQVLLNRRLGRIKSKISTKINNKLDELQDAHANNLNNSGSSIPQSKPPVAEPMTAAEHIQQDKDNAVVESYKLMIETAETNIVCDRIIENYDKISKRFNIELLFNENTRKNGIYDTVVELCNFIDTYDMPTYVKFNTVIETAWYGFERNGVQYKKRDILEAAINFFAFKEDGIKECKSILEATVLYDKSDSKDLDVITEEEPEEDEKSSSGFEEVARYYNNIAPKFFNESSDNFDKIFSDFKKNDLKEHPEKKLKSLVTKLYSLKPSEVIEGTPRFFTWIRSFFILGAGAFPVIGPIIMIVSFACDKILSIHMEKKELEQMNKAFINEIKATKSKIDTTKDKEKKDRLQKYLKELEDAQKKIEEKYFASLSDKELDKAYDNKYASDDSDDLDDFFNLGDMMESVASYAESISESYEIINKESMFNLPSMLDDTMVELVSEAVAMYPDELYFESFASGISHCIREEKRQRSIDGGMDHFIRINALENAFIAAKTIKIHEDPKTIDELALYLNKLDEATQAISILITNESNRLLEASFTNTVRVAQMKLRNMMQKMSDKDRKISKDIDVTMNNLSKNAERALTNDNRESIIKGSIIPSASKCIKLAITTGLAWLVNPAIAVIGLLAYIGTSMKFRSKERQMIVDELEIELKVCDKYLDLAESRNDMKAYKELLTIQRDLERQLQRVKYKMAIKGDPYRGVENVKNAYDKSSSYRK